MYNKTKPHLNSNLIIVTTFFCSLVLINGPANAGDQDTESSSSVTSHSLDPSDTDISLGDLTQGIPSGYNRDTPQSVPGGFTRDTPNTKGGMSEFSDTDVRENASNASFTYDVKGQEYAFQSINDFKAMVEKSRAAFKRNMEKLMAQRQ